MPMRLNGAVALRVIDDSKEALVVDADDFSCEQGGVRILDGGNRRHEFLFRYRGDPRFDLEVTAMVIEGVVELDSLAIERSASVEVIEEQNTLTASFHYDPDRDDEPLTPVSSN